MIPTQERVGGAMPSANELNRRAFPRRRPRGTVGYRPIDRRFGPFVEAKWLDVSQSGTGLLVRQSFVVGDVLEVELVAAGGRKLIRSVEVRWAAPTPDGGCRLGCSWQHRLSYAELALFV